MSTKDNSSISSDDTFILSSDDGSISSQNSNIPAHSSVSSVTANSIIGDAQISNPAMNAEFSQDAALDQGTQMFNIDLSQPEILHQDSIQNPSLHSNLQKSFELSGMIANRYELLKIIGKGGMGEIHLAKDLKLDREVAIKVMLSPNDPTESKRFELESKTVASFSDPHTIRLFDYGTTPDGYQFQVMEYLDGQNIKEHLKDFGPMNPDLAKELTIQICGSLAEAHRKGILHRDIKPGNIMLIHSPERGIQSKLLDFGLVRTASHDPTLTQTGTFLGSPMYMSPDQINGNSDTLTEHSDIYALGLTLYTMLTGKSPFQANNITGILAAQLTQYPTNMTEIIPALKSELTLCWIVQQAIHKDPNLRFASILQMKKALELSLANPKIVLRLEKQQLWSGKHLIEMPTLGSQVSMRNSQNISLPDIATLKHQQAQAFPPETSNMKWVLLGGVALMMAAVTWFLQGDSTPEVTPTTVQPTATVTPKQADVKETLIHLTTTPPNCDILIDGQKVGQSPFDFHLKDSQTQNIELVAEGYQSQTLLLTSRVPNPSITLEKMPKETTNATDDKSLTNKSLTNKSTTPPSTPVNKATQSPKNKTIEQKDKSEVVKTDDPFDE